MNLPFTSPFSKVVAILKSLFGLFQIFSLFISIVNSPDAFNCAASIFTPAAREIPEVIVIFLPKSSSFKVGLEIFKTPGIILNSPEALTSSVPNFSIFFIASFSLL